MEKQSITSLTAIDLSAVFDTVDHTILLAILNNKFGVTGKALKWFDSYLHPRSFKVVVEGVYSQEKDLIVSIPQGSCASAAIFNLYCSPLEDEIPNNLQLSGFADDHSVRNTFKASDRNAELKAKAGVEHCMFNIKQWMDAACLKMNPAKTEFIYFGHTVQLKKCTENTINIAGDLIVRSDIIKYLGVWMDHNLTFKQHITKKCQTAMLNFLRIRSIRQYLDDATTECLVLSLCMSHIDYCNSVLYGLPDCSINKLQRVQNMCSCLVLRKTKRDSSTKCLQQLHWLPVKKRITFKVLVLTFKLLHGDGPMYLKNLIQRYTPGRQGLCSFSDTDLLVIPKTKRIKFASRSFSVAAPTLWNSLPKGIRQTNTLLSFKKRLKTHLFTI